MLNLIKENKVHYQIYNLRLDSLNLREFFTSMTKRHIFFPTR